MTTPDETLLRTLAPRVLGVVARRFGDFAAAEDAVQEALLAAARQWPRDGAPANPAGWLVQVAVRRMADQARGDMARRRREAAVALDEPQTMAAVDEVVPEADDTLLLLFMCCHPALTPASAIALTLRAVGGLTTGEIANAFLVPEATMAQRISRAKRLAALSAALGDKDYLEYRFTAGDLLMVSVLRILRHTDLVARHPNLDAYRLRCEARPAFQKALTDQKATFMENAPA